MNAADVIYDALSGSFGDFCMIHAERALDALAAAGYAVVSVPTVPGLGEYDGIVSVTEVGRVNVYSDYSHLPNDARGMAADILSAAAKAEECVNE